MHRRPTTMSAATLLLITTLITTVTATTEPPSHNITAILSTYPQFTTFNHRLTSTVLADVINNLTDITVCAVDDSAMSELLSFNPTPSSLKLILTIHIFSGYADDFIYSSCCAWTLYPSPTGGREVLDLRGGPGTNFSFTDTYTDHRAAFLGFIHRNLPSRLAVIHVSTFLPSPAAESLLRPIDLREAIAGVGCGLFAGALAEVPEAERWYRENAYAGMTVVCPIDDAFEGHVSRFGSLREEEKISVLLYHALPVYYNEIDMRGLDDSASLWSYYGGGGAATAAAMLDMVAVEKLLVDGAAYDRAPLAVYPIKAVLFPGDREKVDELAPVVHAAAVDSI